MNWLNNILCGDVTDKLREIPEGSVQCVVTSPPYWGLRDYGCEGQIGLEDSPESYVRRIVEVFGGRDHPVGVWRVLRDDGVLWLNLGDTMIGGKPKTFSGDETHPDIGWSNEQTGRPIPIGLKPKDLVGIPWMVAFALRSAGWYLRSEIIWHKPNPMPESAGDRPTRAHEQLFLLSKRPQYFYDGEAIKEPHADKPHQRGKRSPYEGMPGKVNHWPKETFHNPSGRNKRSVWTIPTQGYAGPHYATYPEKLVVPCILAGTSNGGCCPQCGAPWIRVVERAIGISKECPKTQLAHEARGGSGTAKGTVGKSGGGRIDGQTKTVGWLPGCVCRIRRRAGAGVSKAAQDYYKKVLRIWPELCKRWLRGEYLDWFEVAAKEMKTWKTKPCVVLDPFMGSGTTGLVARKLKRDWAGIELNPEDVKRARERIRGARNAKVVKEMKGQMELGLGKLQKVFSHKKAQKAQKRKCRIGKIN